MILKALLNGILGLTYVHCVQLLVMSDFLRPHGLQPVRPLCPQDFPGKNIGVGCHALLQGIFPTQESNLHLLHLLHCRTVLYHWVTGCGCCQVTSVVSDSVWPHRWQPNRLLCPWDSPGKNTGVGCHILLQCMHACKVTSVVSDSVRPYGQQPTMFLRPQDSLGKNTGVGCNFLLHRGSAYIHHSV